MQAIVVDNIAKEYEGRVVLGPISFEVQEKTIHGFLGPNGAGKSTTFKIIAGLLKTTSGRVIVDGNSTQTNLNEVKKSIGILPENAPLMKEMKVGEYLFYVCRLHGLKKDESKKAVEVALKKLSLESVEKRIIGNLSKGYKQRVGIAQAIVFNPKIILLDEPTAGLDPASVIEMRNLILDLKKDHTILFSTHLLHEVEMICDDITIINKGKRVYTGKKDDAFKNSNHLVELSLTSLNATRENFESLKSVKVKSVTLIDEKNGKWLISLENEKDISSKLMKELMQEGIEVLEFKFQKNDLEKLFLEMTEGNKE